MPADSGIKKTVLVALGVCLVCSVFVASAAVGLSAKQEENKKLDRIMNILQAGDIDYSSKAPDEVFAEMIKPVIVDLATGEEVDTSKLDEALKPENFSVKDVAKDPEYTTPLSDDPADIKAKPKYMIVYEVVSGNSIDKYILPIYGKGLWSTLYGFLAIDKDLETVKGITFYEHGETPGLGGEIDNPRWKSIWKGKQALNEKGEVTIEVIKGQVDPTSPDANQKIDGLSGATITTRGVNALVRFWLGEDGYGPFLNKVREVNSNEEV